MVMVMAQIYTNCGRYDEAIQELDYLLSLKTDYTVNTLKVAPWAEPLRKLPGYEVLRKKYPFPEDAT